MEKQLSTIGYSLGLICTVLAVIFKGGALFFLLTIASWCQTAKSWRP